MKREVVIVAVVVAACGSDRELAFFEKSDWRAPLNCTRLGPLNNGAGVSDVTPIGDTAFAAIFADEREIVTYNRTLSPQHVLRFDEKGPRGVLHAVSAAVSDTIFYVADDAAGLIKRFDRRGHDRGSVRLSFVPRRVRLSGHQLLVTPLVAGNNPPHLLFVIANGKADPLGAPIAMYDEVTVNTLANMVSLAAFSDRAVVLHELVVPFGYVVGVDRRRRFMQRFPVPLSSAARSGVGRLPDAPITDKNVNDLTVVGFTAAASLSKGTTYYVTRIGDGKRVAYQKLLVELDTLMQTRAVYPIDVNPHHMVFVEDPAAIIGVDAESNWFECRLS